jgi:hypothetical protein
MLSYESAPHQRRRAGLFAWLTAALVLLATPAWASDATLLFEGTLSTTGGGPASDGDYTLTFALYDAVDGKTALWTETAKVAVAGGRLHHVLGGTTALDAGIAAKGALWLGVTVASEPELPRQALHATPWALRAASANVAAGISCSGCVPVGALKFDGDVDLGGNALKAAAITAQKVTAQTVSTQALTAQSVTAASFVGDGSKLTGLALPSGSCPSGQVVTGIAADGKLVCKSAAGSLPADGLDEVSNKLLTTQFSESFTLPAADIGKAIPDNTGLDLVSTIEIGSVGIAESFFEVDVELVNSDLSKVSIVLLPPDDKKVGITLCDPCGEANAKVLKTTFPKPTATKTGDLSSWLGKNPKGLWNLRIKDTFFCIPQLDKENCDVQAGTDGKLLSWGLRFQVQSSALVGVQGTLVVGGSGSAHTAAAGITAEQQGQAALVAGFPALWTLVVPDFAAQQKVAVPGQMVYRSDLAKTFVRQGKEWRELLTGPMCGDGVRAGGEVCDGADLNNKSCADAKGAGSTGTLGCKLDCTGFDVGKCTEPPYFSGSKILDADGITKVNAWYGNPQQQWTLCYRRSDDGASSSTFHSKCNNKGPTLTVIKNNLGSIYGGYAPVSWTSKGSYVSTTGSWLFSVTSNTKFPYYQNAGNAMYDNASYGPTWGGNHDLYVQGNMTNGYANPGNSHNCPMCSGSCTACQNALAGKYDGWNITELEVWVKN